MLATSRHAGFTKVANSLAPQEPTEIETEPTFNEMFGKISTSLDWPAISLLNNYVEVDDVSTELTLRQKF